MQVNTVWIPNNIRELLRSRVNVFVNYLIQLVKCIVYVEYTTRVTYRILRELVRALNGRTISVLVC